MHFLFVRSAGAIAATGLALLPFSLGARPAQAQATPDPAGYYTYTLNDVAFNTNSSGGTASGYFDYDPTTGAIGHLRHHDLSLHQRQRFLRRRRVHQRQRVRLLRRCRGVYFRAGQLQRCFVSASLVGSRRFRPLQSELYRRGRNQSRYKQPVHAHRQHRHDQRRSRSLRRARTLPVCGARPSRRARLRRFRLSRT